MEEKKNTPIPVEYYRAKQKNSVPKSFRCFPIKKMKRYKEYNKNY